jgi:PAS domain-containing protein
MWRKEIEIVLTRQLSSYLSTPVFIVDAEGNLLFYNEPAETIIGRPFEEAEEMPAQELASLFEMKDENGKAIANEDVPINLVLKGKQPAHSRFWIRSMDGSSRLVETTAIPLIGIGGRFLGALSMFWEAPQ